MSPDPSNGMDVRSLSTSAASLKSEASSTNVAVATASPSESQAVLGGMAFVLLRD